MRMQRDAKMYWPQKMFIPQHVRSPACTQKRREGDGEERRRCTARPACTGLASNVLTCTRYQITWQVYSRHEHRTCTRARAQQKGVRQIATGVDMYWLYVMYLMYKRPQLASTWSTSCTCSCHNRRKKMSTRPTMYDASRIQQKIEDSKRSLYKKMYKVQKDLYIRCTGTAKTACMYICRLTVTRCTKDQR